MRSISVTKDKTQQANLNPEVQSLWIMTCMHLYPLLFALGPLSTSPLSPSIPLFGPPCCPVPKLSYPGIVTLSGSWGLSCSFSAMYVSVNCCSFW